MTTNASLPRRHVLALSLAAFGAPLIPGRAAAQAANQWFALTGDDGRPVPNQRAPVELVDEIEDLRGAIWSGPQSAPVKLIEFYDYNCPWCRAAESTRTELQRSNPDLRVGLVHNPILGPGSAQAAKVDLALLRLKGAGASFKLHQALFAAPGRIDGPRALETAARLGFDRAEVERTADGPDVSDMLAQDMRLAASLGLVATPSYVIGGAIILGYPGPKTLSRVVANARQCGTITC